MTYLNKESGLQKDCRSLLLQLYKTSKNEKTQPLFRAKLTKKNQHYPELEVFKIQLEDDENHTRLPLYSEAKQKLFSYRLVFIGLALLFVLLTAVTYTLSFNWSYTFFFDSTIKGKWLLTSLTSLLCLSAFACAIIPSSLHEATRQVVGKAQKMITRIYKEQRVQNKFDAFMLWGERSRRSSALRHLYHEILDKVQDKGEETYRLLKKIAKTSKLSEKAKEHLYNQALAELHDRLHFAVNNFKNLQVDTAIHPELS